MINCSPYSRNLIVRTTTRDTTRMTTRFFFAASALPDGYQEELPGTRILPNGLPMDSSSLSHLSRLVGPFVGDSLLLTWLA